eukprot:scaffold2522_cov242-Pinguiococcus_pyrenoidosus.AAC.5
MATRSRRSPLGRRWRVDTMFKLPRRAKSAGNPCASTCGRTSARRYGGGKQRRSTVEISQMSADFKETIAKLHAGLRRKFVSAETRDVAWRRRQLKRLLLLLDENAESLSAAIGADLRRPASEASSEVAVTAREAADALASFEDWMRPQWSAAHIFVAPAGQEVRFEPYGASLIVAPYNYPVNLLFAPLVGAFAAGCNAMLKPSEISVATEKLLVQLVPKYFSPEDCCVVSGAAEETAAILELRWDMVFFTGSTRVGKIVAQACAKHLTPHVLELGGKVRRQLLRGDVEAEWRRNSDQVFS